MDAVVRPGTPLGALLGGPSPSITARGTCWQVASCWPSRSCSPGSPRCVAKESSPPPSSLEAQPRETRSAGGGTSRYPRHLISSRRSVVLLRMSTLFLRTLREDPADAEVPSHRLLVRGGYIRRRPGGYTWPLGGASIAMSSASREEMDAMGAQEVNLPALLPKGRTTRATAGRTTATTCSGSRTARAPTTCSVRPTRSSSPCW